MLCCVCRDVRVGEEFCVSLKLKSTAVSLKGVVVAGLRQILGADLSRK